MLIVIYKRVEQLQFLLQQFGYWYPQKTFAYPMKKKNIEKCLKYTQIN